MIRLEHDHEARKTEPYLLRQQLQRIIPEPSLIADAMQVLSGIAILAPTLAKAAAILQHKDTIVMDNLYYRITTQTANFYGRKRDSLDGLLLQKSGFASISDEVSIKQTAWTKRSEESSDLIGHISIYIPETKARKFPLRHQLFGFTFDVLSPESKIDLFQTTLHSRHLGLDDIQDSLPIAWDPISEPEAFNATCQISSTSPALICDVKSASGTGKIAGIVTVDVKRAFDDVLYKRLLYRL
ncbi:hypothetical protein EPUL_002711 [Erysiphe pulchra]|uniref:Uncharacterized protein n=1 Tax=Erysiphe pulchra TaxID=225359 RepID=A0A2S4PRV3_9PEZI|nr:hypothetical protein EPUL_002711 [Erysiphe pulchra]